VAIEGGVSGEHSSRYDSVVYVILSLPTAELRFIAFNTFRNYKVVWDIRKYLVSDWEKRRS
jgi:hypothetical protein